MDDWCIGSARPTNNHADAATLFLERGKRVNHGGILGLSTNNSGTPTDTDIVAKATRICGCNDDVTEPHHQAPYTRCTIQFHVEDKISGEEADTVEVWNYKDGEWYWFWTAHFSQC